MLDTENVFHVVLFYVFISTASHNKNESVVYFLVVKL